tara:strand:- start:56 stop:1252 length:1197 start_codon:yes stop_codon:yes gene_type:complete
MKLFQKLLLAPAALGLFAPIAANANESNFRDVTSYSQDQVEVSLDSFKPLSNKNPLLAGGEGGNQSQTSNDFDIDTFSSTTQASFTSNFAIGTVEGNSSTDDLGVNYDWELALTTSFTGNDSLDVVMNAGVSALYTELDMTSTSSIVKVDSASYTTLLGDKSTVYIGAGDGVAGSALYNTACVYGAQTDTFSNCGVSAANIDEGLGTALGFNFDLGYGFNATVGYEGQGMTKGLLNQESTDAHGFQLSYLQDNYGVSGSWANIERHATVNSVANTVINGSVHSVAINGYYAPDLPNFPSISAGFESNHDDTVSGTTTDNTSHYFVGIQWDDFGNGTLGAAFGSKEAYAENADALAMYEVFYSYNYADGITITPLLYSKENAGATADETGIVLKTQFSF